MRRQRGGRVEVRVPVNRAEAQELRVLETRDHPEDALLLGDAEARLEPDEVPHAPAAILHAQLHDGVRFAPGARIDEADRLHRPEAQRVAAAARHLLGRHAALEVRHGVELVRRRYWSAAMSASRNASYCSRVTSGSSDTRRPRSRPPSSPCRSATRGRRSSSSIESRETIGAMAS